MIYYISYTLPSHEKNNSASPAACTKVNYIEHCLKSSNIPFVSIYTAHKSKWGIYSTTEQTDNNGHKMIIPAGFGGKGKIIRKLHAWQSNLWLWLKLTKLTNEDTVICYHGLNFLNTIINIKRKAKCRFILELEELYQDVCFLNNNKVLLENRIVAHADGYILSALCLKNRIKENKPFIVINGTYKQEPVRIPPNIDNKVHCVYAGTFDPTKGGTAAVAAAEFLPENYHVHILGFGSVQQKANLLEQIKQVQYKTKCTVTFEGLLTGEEYIRFLQSCQIGLCTQIPDAEYAATSFPSKILVYMANGLRVLCPRIAAIEQSDVGEMMNYYLEQNPQMIAKAIQAIDLSLEYNSREWLDTLNTKCKENLQKLLCVK